MATARQILKLLLNPVIALCLIGLIYIVLIFGSPTDPSTTRQYNLSASAYRVLIFLLVLPHLAAWLLAVVGFTKLKEYAITIKNSGEGYYFDKLSNGVAWLALSLPVPALIAFIFGIMANQSPGLRGAAIIISNYVYLILPLVAFTIIGTAARGLVHHAKLQINVASSRLIMLLFATAGVIYCILTFQQFDTNNIASSQNAYFMPLWLAVMTLTIPYLYSWFMGLLAAYEIIVFGRQSRGLLYKRALQLLVLGLTTVIIASIAIQYINGISPRSGALTLDYQLLLLIIFRIVSGVGFGLIALGAIRLKKIEEV